MKINQPIVGTCSHTGSKPINEDSYYTYFDSKFPIGFAIIADGMGGHSEGKEASALAIRKLKYWWNDYITKVNLKNLNLDVVSKQLDGVLFLVNEELLKLKQYKNIVTGTTCSLIFFLNGKYIIKHVGDSRIYLLHQYNESKLNNFIQPSSSFSKMQLLTENHTWVQQQVLQGKITSEDAHFHPKRNILLQCLGIEKNLNISTYHGTYEENDLFLLATDGLYGVMSEQELFINLKLMPENSVQNFCDIFMHATLQYYEIHDNLTFILCGGPISQKNKLLSFFNKYLQ